MSAAVFLFLTFFVQVAVGLGANLFNFLKIMTITLQLTIVKNDVSNVKKNVKMMLFNVKNDVVDAV